MARELFRNTFSRIASMNGLAGERVPPVLLLVLVHANAGQAGRPSYDTGSGGGLGRGVRSPKNSGLVRSCQGLHKHFFERIWTRNDLQWRELDPLHELQHRIQIVGPVFHSHASIWQQLTRPGVAPARFH